MSDENLLIFGASTRAAAYSALRAGLRCWCADLYGDVDLRAISSAQVIAAPSYPNAFLDLIKKAPDCPWMYTGGLENHPDLIHRLAKLRPLWGNDAATLRAIRSPLKLAATLQNAGLPSPQVRTTENDLPRDGSWLVKSISSAGGGKIYFLDKAWQRMKHGSVYFQEFIEGESCAAIYLGDGRSARLLGTTRQLVGATWLNAAPFVYCGSIGPRPTSLGLTQALERLGVVLTTSYGLRGLFGVDCIVRDDRPWTVEVNPRYTASVEVLEYSQGTPALALHRSIFEPMDPIAVIPTVPREPVVVGKAILFARNSLRVPENFRWQSESADPRILDSLPEFADIPKPGERILAKRPVCTVFAQGASLKACEEKLRQIMGNMSFPGIGVTATAPELHKRCGP